MDISVIIVNLNTRQLLLDCLRSVHETVTDLEFEVFVVDNGSTDGSLEAVGENFPRVKVIANGRNLGFAAANNKALAVMEGDYALLLNTDAELTPDAVHALWRFMESEPKAGMACGQLLNSDGSLQNSTANLPTLASLLINESLDRLIRPGRYPSKRPPSEPVEVESAIGACLMVRRAAMDQVGLLDEDYFFFFEETDWAERFRRAGWRVFFVPTAKIYHHQGQTVGHGSRSRLLYYSSRYTYFRKQRPGRHRLYAAAAAGRLAVNTLLTLASNIGTLGLVESQRRRLKVYLSLVRWHLSGCPDPRPGN